MWSVDISVLEVFGVEWGFNKNSHSRLIMVYRAPRGIGRRRVRTRRQLATRHVRPRYVPPAPVVPFIPPMAPRYFRGALRAGVPLRNQLRHAKRRLKPMNRGLTYWQRKSMRKLLYKPLGKLGSKFYSKGW